jgi:hypothetical protein
MKTTFPLDEPNDDDFTQAVHNSVSASYGDINPGAGFVSAPGLGGSASSGTITTTVSSYPYQQVIPGMPIESGNLKKVDVSNRKLITELRELLLQSYDEIAKLKEDIVDIMTMGKLEEQDSE